MKLKMILAMDESGALGLDGDLPWGREYPQDLKYFQKVTKENTVVYGLNTYLSFKRPLGLPNRNNVVITTKPHLVHGDVSAWDVERLQRELVNLQVNPRSSAFSHMPQPFNSHADVFFIGGKAMYLKFLPLVEELHITRIPGHHVADVYMPVDFGSGVKWETMETVELEGGLKVEVFKR